MKHKQKIVQILAFSNWSQDRFADLLGVGNFTVSRWLKGRSMPKERHAEIIDEMYDVLVEPYRCEMEEKADKLAEKLLRGQIAALREDNSCQK